MARIYIGPVSDNQNTELKLLFGSNVSANSIVDYVRRDTTMREECGLISDDEACAMISEAEAKLKTLSLP
jgi:hypothetical protein